MNDPRLASSRLHADFDRLRAQVGLSWTREASQLTRLGLQDGMSILEVGSGPGFITERLLEALPHCTVTAVELDPNMCDAARTRLARYVFQHLSAPDLAASEIFRLLKPGGRIAILDIDDDLGGVVVPNMPAFTQLARKVRQLQATYSGDREIGRKLWRLLADAGYVQLDLDMVVFHSDDLGLEAFLPQYDPKRYRTFVSPGGLSADEWEHYRQAYAQFLSAPDALIVQLIMLASGTKP